MKPSKKSKALTIAALRSARWFLEQPIEPGGSQRWRVARGGKAVYRKVRRALAPPAEKHPSP